MIEKTLLTIEKTCDRTCMKIPFHMPALPPLSSYFVQCRILPPACCMTSVRSEIALWLSRRGSNGIAIHNALACAVCGVPENSKCYRY